MCSELQGTKFFYCRKRMTQKTASSFVFPIFRRLPERTLPTPSDGSEYWLRTKITSHLTNVRKVLMATKVRRGNLNSIGAKYFAPFSGKRNKEKYTIPMETVWSKTLTARRTLVNDEAPFLWKLVYFLKLYFLAFWYQGVFLPNEPCHWHFSHNSVLSITKRTMSTAVKSSIVKKKLSSSCEKSRI